MSERIIFFHSLFLYFLVRLLASKNLPAAIEDVSGDQLPESIREKSEQIRSQGGISSLEEKIYGLPELLQRNKEIIDEVNLYFVWVIVGCSNSTTCRIFCCNLNKANFMGFC